MKVTVRKMTETEADVVIEGVHFSFVNALRRTMLAEVPKMAIDDVTVYDNTSALFDEMLSHRLGLVPVPTDLDAFVPRATCPSCNGEGCANCTILYTLSKEGPAMVVSGDLTPVDPRFKIKDDKIPIVKLLEGQRVMLEAAAVMSTGREHAKWSPVHGLGYKEMPRVEIKASPAIPPHVVEWMQKAAPEGVMSFDGGRVAVVDEERAFEFLRSAKRTWDARGVKLDQVVLTTTPEKFVFTFETDGSISCKEALSRAVAILMEKLKHVEGEVPKLKVEEAAEAA